SNVSTCDIPPLRNRKITFLAFAGKCGAFGESGLAGDSPCRAPASPTIPNPLPTILRASRLVIDSIHRAELARAQQCLGVPRPGVMSFTQEIQPELSFRLSGLAPVKQTVSARNPRRVVAGFSFQPLCQGAGLARNEAAVH